MKALVIKTIKSNRQTLFTTILVCYLSSFVLTGYHLSTNAEVKLVAFALLAAYLVPTAVILMIFIGLMLLETFKK